MKYKNPINYKDLSDPDVIRVDSDYYMVSSSFNYLPGVPILHSKDLVNFEIINYVFDKYGSEYNSFLHGKGAWAPSLRYYNGYFYCFIPFPDEGIYVARSKDIYGKFETWMLNPIKGLIDPCPIWYNGICYCVCGFAKSRIGFNSKLAIFEVSDDCKTVLSDYRIIFDGSNTQPVIEGPKIYFINDYFYILAPAGSVESGWQTCLRSKNIYGPYEEKIVMIQSDTLVNGPHQGGLVQSTDGKYWFLHFQSKKSYGRITHLQPVNFINDWPIIGETTNTTGKPVMEYDCPEGKLSSINNNKDFYFKDTLGLEWQTPTNNVGYYEITDKLYLNGVEKKESLFYQPNLLVQMPFYKHFSIETNIVLNSDKESDISGIMVFGKEYLFVGINGKKEICIIKGGEEIKDEIIYSEFVNSLNIYFKMIWNDEMTSFLYSLDNKSFKVLYENFKAIKGIWVGAKIGLFNIGSSISEVTYYKKEIL